LTDTCERINLENVGKPPRKLSELARMLAKERWRHVSPKERSKVGSELSRIRWKNATDEDREAARQRLAENRKKRWPKERKVDGKKRP
jgi:hypothetical protein